ncbi:MAG: hypothetical protein IJ503_07400 [Akkermansia sp.]|nr:hypothetical protein [Akkermansia sp.]
MPRIPSPEWVLPVTARLAENVGLHKRFSVTFLSAIDKALRMNRRDRWQSAQEWLATLTPAKDVRDGRLRHHQGRQQAVPRHKTPTATGNAQNQLPKEPSVLETFMWGGLGVISAIIGVMSSVMSGGTVGRLIKVRHAPRWAAVAAVVKLAQFVEIHEGGAWRFT